MLAPDLAQDRDDRGELAGPVDDVEPQLRQAALARELTGQHAGQQPRVDVAAAEHQADRAALEARRIGEHRRQAGGAGAFGHGLLDGEEKAQRLLDLLLGHEHDIVDQRGARSRT